MTDEITVGSLFTGYGGLDLAVEAVTGARPAWVSDIDPGACRILEERFPGVPNLGDISAIDWSAVPPVEILTGGFPCQDVSAAGKRAGLAGHRSGLWARMHDAITALRPPLVVIENVRGLLTARGDEPTDELLAAWDDRDRAARIVRLLTSKLTRAQREGKREYVHRHARDRIRMVGRLRRAVAEAKRADARIIRAIGTVLGSLADIGYDAAWLCRTAAGVGAPHGRFRVFIVAWPTEDTDSATGDERRVAASRDAEVRRSRANAGRRGRAPAAAADTDGPRRQREDRTEGVPGPGPDSGARITTRRAVIAADAGHGNVAEWARPAGRDPGERSPIGSESGRTGQPAADAVGSRRTGRALDEIRPEIQGAPPAGSSADPAADTDGDGLGSIRRQHAVECDPDRRHRPDQPGQQQQPQTQWGAYGPAVERWATVLGRPAPPPTETGPKGGQRLSPRFVEWMMGLPAGWVTDVPGLTRNDQLKALGNGVVPRQAELALRTLLEVIP